MRLYKLIPHFYPNRSQQDQFLEVNLHLEAVLNPIKVMRVVKDAPGLEPQVSQDQVNKDPNLDLKSAHSLFQVFWWTKFLKHHKKKCSIDMVTHWVSLKRICAQNLKLNPWLMRPITVLGHHLVVRTLVETAFSVSAPKVKAKIVALVVGESL